MSEQLNEGEVEAQDSETAPEQKEKVTFSDDQQVIVNRLTAEGRENVRTERQKTADVQRQLEEARALVPKETRPNVSNAGDIYDDNFEANQQARETQIREQAEFDTRQQVGAEQAHQAQVVEQNRQQAVFNDSITKFNGTAESFGIDSGTLQQMDGAIASHGGLRHDVGSRVLADDKGMLIYRHFSQNPDDIYTINRMSEGDAAVFVNEIKVKAVALNAKRTSSAPDPAQNLSGSGLSPTKRGSGGATFE